MSGKWDQLKLHVTDKCLQQHAMPDASADMRCWRYVDFGVHAISMVGTIKSREQGRPVSITQIIHIVSCTDTRIEQQL